MSMEVLTYRESANRCSVAHWQSPDEVSGPIENWRLASPAVPLSEVVASQTCPLSSVWMMRNEPVIDAPGAMMTVPVTPLAEVHVPLTLEPDAARVTVTGSVTVTPADRNVHVPAHVPVIDTTGVVGTSAPQAQALSSASSHA